MWSVSTRLIASACKQETNSSSSAGLILCFRPVVSYGGTGVARHNLSRNEIGRHAIIYMSTDRARPSPAERELEDLLIPSFAVTPERNAKLHQASRLRVDTPHTVRYNLPVKSMGRIINAAEVERLVAHYLRAASG